MKKSLFLLLIIMAGCRNYDIIITNGNIYDGSGGKPIIADIAVRDGMIVMVSPRISGKAESRIDARGLAICPGFIDIHTHCDDDIFEPGLNKMENYLLQGVTTLVGGNCGSGTYRVDEYFRKLDSIGIGANVVHLAGHNAIRNKVMKMDNREPTAEELQQMKELLEKAMQEGAAGLATGLFYTPGIYSATPEVVELAKVAKKYDGFYATHLRDESDYNIGLVEAVKEAIAVGEQAGIRVEIAHIKALGKPVWGSSGQVASIIAEARKKGINIIADQYPYNASSTGLSAAVIPSWALAGGRLSDRLSDPATLKKIKKEMAENIERRGGPESLVIVSSPQDERFTGRSLKEIAVILDKDPVETALFLVQSGIGGIVSFNMQDADILHFMKQDFVITASDGSLVQPGRGVPHPRSYGTFTRKIRRYVNEEKVLTMEEAIKKATSMPAEMIGLKTRGLIREGMTADILVFDKGKITDSATFTDPHKYSSGVEWLLIGGTPVVEKGIYNGKLAGSTLRRDYGK